MAGGYHVFFFFVLSCRESHLNNVSSLFFFVSKYGIKSNTPARVMGNESDSLFHVYLLFAASCMHIFQESWRVTGPVAAMP